MSSGLHDTRSQRQSVRVADAKSHSMNPTLRNSHAVRVVADIWQLRSVVPSKSQLLRLDLSNWEPTRVIRQKLQSAKVASPKLTFVKVQ